MRTSQRKTTVAVHRSLLGIKVADYSDMIGRKTSYLQGIETGRERLTEELALIIEKQTAVSHVWLLAGNVNNAPFSEAGEPYSLETFKRRRQQIETGNLPRRGFIPGMIGVGAEAIFASANKSGDDSLFRHRYGRALNELEHLFGKDETTERNHEITALALKSLRDIFYLKRHSRTGKPLRGKYAIKGYEETRRVFFEQLEELRKQARRPLAMGMPASGPGLLPILEIVATLVFIEPPWWFKDEMPDDDESP